MHGTKDVRLGRLAHRVLLIVGQNDHIFTLVPKEAIEVVGHVFHVVDAPSQLTSLAEIVDTYEQSLPSTIAQRILESVV